MRLAFATLFLLLAACGQVAPRDAVTVRAYTDSRGVVTPHSGSLGFTYWAGDGSGAKYAEPGWNVLINPSTARSPDDDLVVRVLIHELGNVVLLDSGDTPAYGVGWFLWDSDTLPPFTEIGPDEAAWFASHARPYRVNVKDDWLRQPTAEAILRINLAAGAEIFK